MLKKLKTIVFISMVFSLLFISDIAGATGYVRENSFLNATGQERTNEIKRFQALNNIVVTGKLDARTKEILYNKDLMAYDSVENPPTSGLWIVVNKTKKTLTVYKGTYVDVKFPVTLGSSSTPTPTAKASITNLVKNPAWGGMNGKYTPIAADDPKNPLGERWMGLKIPGEFGYGIHGTIKPWEIGTYVSNGCIRMFNYDIENFVFPKMKTGTPVWIGTDKELNSWGVYQYVDKAANNPTIEIDIEIPSPEEPEKPVEPEKPAEPVEPEKPPVVEDTGKVGVIKSLTEENTRRLKELGFQ